MGERIGRFILSTKMLPVWGMGVALAYPPYGIIPVLWISLSVLMSKLNRATRKKTAVFHSFLFAAGLAVALLAFLGHVFAFSEKGYFFGPVIMIGAVVMMAVPYMVAAFLCLYFKKGGCRWVAFATLFGLAQYGQIYLFFNGLPWDFLANVWGTYLPVLQVASIVGSAGLSTLTMLIFTAPALWWTDRWCVWASFVLLSVLSIGGIARMDGEGDRFILDVYVRIVQPNLTPQEAYWDFNRSKTKDVLKELSFSDNARVTHLIWPETVFPFSSVEPTSEWKEIIPAGRVLITGAVRPTGTHREQNANAVLVFDENQRLVDFYDKTRLVPFSEYVPAERFLPSLQLFEWMGGFIPGMGPKMLHIPNAPAASALICIEEIYSGAVVPREKRPEWLIIVSNDGYLGKNGIYQSYAHAVMRAVEEGLPVFRSAKYGLSGVINPLGETLDRVPIGERGYIDSAVPVSISTVFSRFGYGVFFVLSGILLGVAYFGGRRKKRRCP